MIRDGLMSLAHCTFTGVWQSSRSFANGFRWPPQVSTKAVCRGWSTIHKCAVASERTQGVDLIIPLWEPFFDIKLIKLRLDYATNLIFMASKLVHANAIQRFLHT
jgi:hypothetical protein